MFRILLDPHRGRQRPQRPLRDVVAPVARSAPLLLPRGQAQRVAVSFLDGEPASLHELDLAGLCGCRPTIRTDQTHHRSHAPPLCRGRNSRHSHTTLLLSLGVPLPVVSKRLGHSSPQFTASVYSHALPRDERAAAEIFEAAFQKKVTADQNARVS